MMKPIQLYPAVLFSLAALTANALAQQQCTSQSPAHKLALVELYTSEGCSSCPPAERWLGTPKPNQPGHAIALAFHVTYWDYLGWKDAFARPIFTERQRWLTAVNNGRSVYTPGVFVNGQELANWSSSNAFDNAVSKANSTSAQAVIRIAREPATEKGQTIAKVSAVLNQPSNSNSIQLHIATTTKPFANKVSAGENSGEVLQHAHVVDQWAKAVVFSNTSQASAQVIANEKTSAVVALVQDTKTGSILQAFAVSPQCEASQ